MQLETSTMLRLWWIGEIKGIIERITAQEEKRQEQIRKKNLKALGDYKTYNDIQEAYGVGTITEKQFDRLADLLEKSNPEPDKLYMAKIELLQELYREQRQILNETREYKQFLQDGGKE